MQFSGAACQHQSCVCDVYKFFDAHFHSNHEFDNQHCNKWLSCNLYNTVKKIQRSKTQHKPNDKYILNNTNMYNKDCKACAANTYSIMYKKCKIKLNIRKIYMVNTIHKHCIQMDFLVQFLNVANFFVMIQSIYYLLNLFVKSFC